MVQLFGREGGIGGCHDDILAADGLDQRGFGGHQVALGLDDGEVFAEGPLVVQTLLERVEADRALGIEPRDIALVGEEGHLADLAQEFGVVSVAHGACNLLDDALSHAVDQKVGAAFDQQRGLQLVAPVVVVGEPPQRGFDASDDDRDVGIQPFEDLRVDRHGVIGSEPSLSAGGVGVVVAQAEVGRVVVDHRVHGAPGYAEEEPRSAQFGEIAQVVAPVGLGDDRHAVALGFEQAPHDGGPEGRMVDVGIAREEDHVQLIPSAFADLLDGCRQKHVSWVIESLQSGCCAPSIRFLPRPVLRRCRCPTWRAGL